MKITHIDIQNFRKLKNCRVELASKRTVFVGANNSGKTSAMDALKLFLKRENRISTTDFTLSNWLEINQIGNDWVSDAENESPIPTKATWWPLVPTIDIWIHVENDEFHYVSHIIPTLNWSGGILGVRLILEPKKPEELFRKFTEEFKNAKKLVSSRNSQNSEENSNSLSLWPKSIQDFLDKKLSECFEIRAYILDPTKENDDSPQVLSDNSEPLEGDPFSGLFKIDSINAQRGFSDPTSTTDLQGNDRKLSTQLRHYFDKHLNPTESPGEDDLEALQAMEEAKKAFDERLKTSFKPAITELEVLNYPGFDNPTISLASKVTPLEGLDHDSAVQFNVARGTETADLPSLSLPEKYNGLGYQNLISMVFKLIRFRDEWMKVGKAGKKISEKEYSIAPVHLVLIEEPEAHLHVQVQQVFIKKAYEVLRHHVSLGTERQYSTQMVVSTHSSHLAHEVEFKSLRYFRRLTAEGNNVPFVKVINLTETFGTKTKTSKFVSRYLKATHCDLFFADAALIVEGSAERMLLPHFVRSQYPELDKCFISILEIGGSHAHRLRNLIEKLGLWTLVITDLDSVGEDNKRILPARGNNHRTSNDTLKEWTPGKTSLDELIDAPDESKVTEGGLIRVAYQHEMSLVFDDGGKKQAIPYTFEDALVLSNLAMFRELENATGLLKKMCDAANKDSLNEACEEMFKVLSGSDKAKMALDLLYLKDPTDLQAPPYIADGLEWLKQKLIPQDTENAPHQTVNGDES